MLTLSAATARVGMQTPELFASIMAYGPDIRFLTARLREIMRRCHAFWISSALPSVGKQTDDGAAAAVAVRAAAADAPHWRRLTIAAASGGLALLGLAQQVLFLLGLCHVLGQHCHLALRAHRAGRGLAGSTETTGWSGIFLHCAYWH